MTFHEYLPLQSTFRSKFFPACFADAAPADIQLPERNLPSTSSVPTVAQGASRSFRCPSSRRQLRASTCCAEIPIPRYVPSMAFHLPSTVCSAPKPCRLISSRNRVQGSTFRGLTSSVELYRVVLSQCPHAVRDAIRRPKPSNLAYQPRL